MSKQFKNIKLIDIINIFCFIGVFIIAGNLLDNEKSLIYRCIYSALFVWGASNTGLIIKKLYLNLVKKEA